MTISIAYTRGPLDSNPPFMSIQSIVFDTYVTLFDVCSIGELTEKLFPTPEELGLTPDAIGSGMTALLHYVQQSRGTK